MGQFGQHILVGPFFLLSAAFCLRQLLVNLKNPRADWLCRSGYSLMGFGSWEGWVVRHRVTYAAGVVIGLVGGIGLLVTA
jgi:hypothetical protein